MRTFLVLASCAVALSGCAVAPSDIGREPRMSPVGSGLQANVDQFSAYSFPAPLRTSPQSLWDDNRANFFRDPRASRVGDVLTVTIAIDDKATLDNSSDRTAKSTLSDGLTFSVAGKTTGQLDATSTSKYEGTGTIDRSEKIQLSVAAVVSGVLPDGNLIVSGSQEVRVNYEMRLLNIAGIVRPRDISKDNTIPYDKIAEARISYGGRGRSSEVQQPGWGQQIFDAIKPY